MITVNIFNQTYLQKVNYNNDMLSKHSSFQNTYDTCSFTGIRPLTKTGPLNTRVKKITSSPNKFSIEESLLITRGLLNAIFVKVPVKVKKNKQYINIKQIPYGFKDGLKIYPNTETDLYDLISNGNFYKIEMFKNENGIFEIKSANEIIKENIGGKILSKPQQVSFDTAKEALLDFFKKVQHKN